MGEHLASELKDCRKFGWTRRPPLDRAELEPERKVSVRSIQPAKARGSQ